jgi:translation elongation factor EF-G
VFCGTPGSRTKQTVSQSNCRYAVPRIVFVNKMDRARPIHARPRTNRIAQRATPIAIALPIGREKN